MKYFITILFLFIFNLLFATNHYFSATGSDLANGLTPATAQQTIIKLNAVFSTYAAGDSILFKRGDSFYGGIIASKSGTIGSRIVIGAYGTGAKPIITGLTTTTGYSSVGTNLWQSAAITGLNNPNMVLINNIVTAKGRYPNYGYRTFQASVANSSITDNSLSGSPNWTGAIVNIRKLHDIISNDSITNHTNKVITYTGTSGYNSQNGYGYFIENSLLALDTANEWYFNRSTRKINVYALSSPTNVKIATIDTLLYLAGFDYITVDNLSFEGGNVAAICFGGPLTGQVIAPIIQNCDINYSGRDAVYGSNNTGFIFNNNTINNSLNNAVLLAAQGGRSLYPTITNNTIDSTAYLAGMGYINATQSYNFSYNGITATGQGALIQYNTITNTGHSAVAFHRDSVKVKNNLINNTCFVTDDAGSINVFDLSFGVDTETGREITDNIILNGVGAGEGTLDGLPGVHSIYIDDKSDGIFVSRNSVANSNFSCFFIHNGTNINVRDNTFFNGVITQTLMVHDNHAINMPIRNIDFNNNILFSTWELKYINQIYTIRNDVDSMYSSIDSNIYTRPIFPSGNTILTRRLVNNVNVTNNYTFPTWRGAFPLYDIHTNYFVKTIADTTDVDFEYNASNVDKIVTFAGLSKMDVRGNVYVNRDTLGPWESKIYLANGSASISATLDGSASFDPEGFPIATWLWEKISGPTGGTITNPNQPITTVTGLQVGVYQYKLTVTDNVALSASDYMQITVNDSINTPPVANAGIDQTKTLPVNTATLNGSGSTDAGGTIVSYHWSKAVSSPVAGTLSTPDSVITTVTNLVEGIYTFVLTVTDNKGGIGIDTMRITVLAAITPPSADGAFIFTLPNTRHTSAGVFKSDSILVRTLWSDSIITQLTDTAHWDGLDDYGHVIPSPDATYTIKVLSDSVKYAWQGTIGNTSDSMTGESKHRGYYHCARGIAFGPTYGYMAKGYSEGSPSFYKFPIASPNVKIDILGHSVSTADINFVATDGAIVYWGCIDANLVGNTFVFGTNVSNDAYVTFANGVSYTPKFRSPLNVISYVSTGGAISGLAVQRTGSYLFVARQSLNQLQVLNKTTGALVQTISYSRPTSLAVDGSDNLWMITDSVTVSKYTVNLDGTLTAATLTLSGLIQSLAVQVSTDGTTVVVCEGKTQQVVKGFSNTTGVLLWTLGTVGGYQSDALVNNAKFYFNDASGASGSAQYNKLPFIAYQPDGSFWVNDPGNFRVQKYNSSRTWVNRIMNLGANYSLYVDPNNINRVWSGAMEFEIDYSVQTLTGTTGWQLKRNWIYAFRHMTTLSNGRTYGQAVKGLNWEIYEFPASGQYRATGVIVNGGNKILCSDGSFQDFTGGGGVVTLRRYPLASFNALGDPSWSSVAEVLATGTQNYTTGNPIGLAPIQQNFSTTNKVMWYNPKLYSNNVGPVIGIGYRLGVMPRGSTDFWLWMQRKSTHRTYKGPYPDAGFFDIGNNVNDFAGSAANIIDRHIVTGNHDEFWKNGQTNKYNHYYDNGLAIGQFGVTREEVGFANHAAAKMAGNALTPQLVKDASGNFYLYHGDESDHSAFHRWKISNLSSIAIQSITIPFPSAYTLPVRPYVDLMIGLPFDVPLPDGQNGWTRNPTVNVGGTTSWTVQTQQLTYDSLKTNDVYMKFSSNAANTYTVSRALGNNNVATNWKITGIANFGAQYNGAANNFYIEVLDNTGKVITTMSPVQSPSRVTGNGILVNTLSANIAKDFVIKIVSGVVTFTWDGVTSANTVKSDPASVWQRLTTLRFRFNSVTGLPNNPLTEDVQELKLYTDF